MGFGTGIRGFKTEAENPFTCSIRFEPHQFQGYRWRFRPKQAERVAKAALYAFREKAREPYTIWRW